MAEAREKRRLELEAKMAALSAKKGTFTIPKLEELDDVSINVEELKRQRAQEAEDRELRKQDRIRKEQEAILARMQAKAKAEGKTLDLKAALCQIEQAVDWSTVFETKLDEGPQQVDFRATALKSRPRPASQGGGQDETQGEPGGSFLVNLRSSSAAAGNLERGAKSEPTQLDFRSTLKRTPRLDSGSQELAGEATQGPSLRVGSLRAPPAPEVQQVDFRGTLKRTPRPSGDERTAGGELGPASPQLRRQVSGRTEREEPTSPAQVDFRSALKRHVPRSDTAPEMIGVWSSVTKQPQDYGFESQFDSLYQASLVDADSAFDFLDDVGAPGSGRNPPGQEDNPFDFLDQMGGAAAAVAVPAKPVNQSSQSNQSRQEKRFTTQLAAEFDFLGGESEQSPTPAQAQAQRSPARSQQQQQPSNPRFTMQIQGSFDFLNELAESSQATPTPASAPVRTAAPASMGSPKYQPGKIVASPKQSPAPKQTKQAPAAAQGAASNPRFTAQLESSFDFLNDVSSPVELAAAAPLQQQIATTAPSKAPSALSSPTPLDQLTAAFDSDVLAANSVPAPSPAPAPAQAAARRPPPSADLDFESSFDFTVDAPATQQQPAPSYEAQVLEMLALSASGRLDSQPASAAAPANRVPASAAFDELEALFVGSLDFEETPVAIQARPTSASPLPAAAGTWTPSQMPPASAPQVRVEAALDPDADLDDFMRQSGEAGAGRSVEDLTLADFGLEDSYRAGAPGKQTAAEKKNISFLSFEETSTAWTPKGAGQPGNRASLGLSSLDALAQDGLGEVPIARPSPGARPPAPKAAPEPGPTQAPGCSMEFDLSVLGDDDLPEATAARQALVREPGRPISTGLTSLDELAQLGMDEGPVNLQHVLQGTFQQQAPPDDW